MNKIIKVPVELIPRPRREDGKTYKGNLDREVKLIQPDESPSPTNAIPRREALAAGFVVPDGVYTLRYPDGTSTLVRVQGGRLMEVAAKLRASRNYQSMPYALSRCLSYFWSGFA